MHHVGSSESPETVKSPFPNLKSTHHHTSRHQEYPSPLFWSPLTMSSCWLVGVTQPLSEMGASPEIQEPHLMAWTKGQKWK